MTLHTVTVYRFLYTNQQIIGIHIYDGFSLCLFQAPEQSDPKNVPTGGLFDLTDDSFPKHIETGSHFIKFYAPWCGHCKRLAPTWEDLAMQYLDQEDVSVAKVTA